MCYNMLVIFKKGALIHGNVMPQTYIVSIVCYLTWKIIPLNGYYCIAWLDLNCPWCPIKCKMMLLDSRMHRVFLSTS